MVFNITTFANQAEITYLLFRLCGFFIIGKHYAYIKSVLVIKQAAVYDLCLLFTY